MSKCFGCFFHEGGFMYNRCNYFEMEYFSEKGECLAFSTDGTVSEENENQIFIDTGGFFGKPMAERKEE